MLSFFHFNEVQTKHKKSWNIRKAEVKENISIKFTKLEYTYVHRGKVIFIIHLLIRERGNNCVHQ